MASAPGGEFEIWIGRHRGIRIRIGNDRRWGEKKDKG
jgi:hypothetical protein